MVSVAWLLIAVAVFAGLAGWAAFALTKRSTSAVAAARQQSLQLEASMARDQASEALDRARSLQAALDAERNRAALLAEEKGRLAAGAAHAESLGSQLQTLRSDLEESRASKEAAFRDLAAAQAKLANQSELDTERAKESERQRLEFQALANRVFEEKGRDLKDQNTEQIGAILNPLREEIGGFKKLVSDVYEKEGLARSSLQTELKQVLDLNKRLSDEANSLTKALTTDNRTQGYWGELKLERLLETAGLVKGTEYLTQESYEDLLGDRYRPDAVLLLPEGRNIIVDAKMSLTDYQRACEAVDEDRNDHLDRHASSLRSHFRQLGEKDYSKLEGLNSPDMVLMFIPVEGAFLEGVRRDPTLWEEAFNKKIVIVGPGNLLATLRLIGQVWKTEQQNKNAKAIADRAAFLYDKFVGFTEDMTKVGDSIKRAESLHRSAVDKLSQGRGNLVRQAERLRELGVTPSKRFPLSMRDISQADEEGGEGASDPDIE